MTLPEEMGGSCKPALRHWLPAPGQALVAWAAGGSNFDPRIFVPPRTVLLRSLSESGPLGSNEGLMDEEIARAARAKQGSPFLSTDQAAFYLGLSARKLQQMRGEGRGPIFRRHSRCVRYHIDDLDNWSRGISGLDIVQNGGLR